MPEVSEHASGTRRRSADSQTGEQIANVLLLPVSVVRQVLPANEVPVLLGAGALAVAGLIDWPAAVAVGLGYAALRRWGPKGGAR